MLESGCTPPATTCGWNSVLACNINGTLFEVEQECGADQYCYDAVCLP